MKGKHEIDAFKSERTEESFRQLPIKKNSAGFIRLSAAVSLALLVLLAILGVSFLSSIKNQEEVKSNLLETIKSQREEINRLYEKLNTAADSLTENNELKATIEEQRKLIEQQQAKIDELVLQAENKVSAPGDSDDKPNSAPSTEPGYISYTVQAGDNIYSICKNKGIDYGKNIALITEINGLSDPDLIDIGQILKLPAPDA